jgi:lipid-A-disaccharide synthase
MFEKHCGKAIHPEFIQDEVNVKNLLNAFHNYKREHFLQDSKILRAYLQSGSSKNVAKIILG